ncbi:hypothetical protein JCM11641_002131 [Rhodosporidiobolus odoratus]
MDRDTSATNAPASSGSVAPSPPPPVTAKRRPLSAIFTRPINPTSRTKPAKRPPITLPPLNTLDSHLPPISADPETYSPLQAPALPFSSRARTRSQPSSHRSSRGDHSGPPSASSSSSSLASLARAARPTSRVDLTQPRTEAPSASPSSGTTMQGYPADDLNGGGAEEELLDDKAVAGAKAGTAGYVDPYSWERPLDAVNRHSRFLDTAPVVPGTAFGSDQRRLSRLPPGVSMVDPFGINLTSDVSPYDLAAFSQGPPSPGAPSHSSSPVRNSFLAAPGVTAAPQMSPRFSGASGSTTASASASSSAFGSAAASTPATSPGSSEHNVALQSGGPQAPWMKPRASSAGEIGYSRAQVRNGLLAPGMPRGVSQRSKLSGEIDADTMSLASTPRQSPPAIPGVPTDSDYLNSKLYQRTLKAQKALEKERAKAAAKGKLSRYDEGTNRSTGSLALGFNLGGNGSRTSTSSHRPPSIMSATGVAGAIGKRSGRKSLGWFRSASEAALPLSEPHPQHLAPSKSSSQLSMQAGRRSSSAGSSPVSMGAGGLSGSSTPLPPSPNLPSEATLRAMGVSQDQLRAASKPSPPGTANGVPPSPRKEERGRPQSAGGNKRSPQASVQPSMSPVPPSPPDSVTTFTNAQRQRPSSPTRPSALPLSPLLQPAPTTRPTYSRNPSSDKSAPAPTASSSTSSRPAANPASTSSAILPRLASKAVPNNNPLPSSAPPSLTAFPTSDTSPPPSASPSPQAAVPPPTRQHSLPSKPPASSTIPAPVQAATPASPLPQRPPSLQPRALLAGAAPGSARPVVSPSTLAPPQSSAQVKRRRSGLGSLFSGLANSSGSSSDKNSSASNSTLRGASPVPSPQRQRDVVRDKEKEKDSMLKRMEERQMKEAQLKKKPPRKEGSASSGGGLFGGKSRGAPSAASAPPPPPGARPPEKPKKKQDEPFFHPSQGLFPPPPAAAALPPTRSPVPSRHQQIRAINASPLVSSHPSSPNPSADAHAHSARNGSSGSSTTFSSLSSSASTLPPLTPANPAIYLDPTGNAVKASLSKKSGFASLFGGGRSRVKSNAPPLTPIQGKGTGPDKLREMQQGGGKGVIDAKALPVLPQQGQQRPPRGQSLNGQQPARGDERLPMHQSYATYA